ncbi:MAG: helix-turn-helix transcriptional regulator [Propionibacteriaceae bacterium]
MTISADTTTPSPVLDSAAAANYLGVGHSTIREWRYLGTGPRYAKIRRLVRYRVVDLDQWLEDQVRATSGRP